MAVFNFTWGGQLYGDIWQCMTPGHGLIAPNHLTVSPLMSLSMSS